MQIAVIEFARKVLGNGRLRQHRIQPRHASSGNPSHAGVLRCGRYGRIHAARPLAVANSSRGTLVRAAYGQPSIRERHRHRMEFNNRYRRLLRAEGMTFSGLSPDSKLVEIIEFEGHPLVRRLPVPPGVRLATPTVHIRSSPAYFGRQCVTWRAVRRFPYWNQDPRTVT